MTMANRQTRASSNASRPHAVSLKVLRLSRPSLATQTPRPPTSFGNGLEIPAVASLAYPSANEQSTFPLTPLLTLPAAFGAAYVGESFACTLCANNEVVASDGGDARTVSGLRIAAELQMPSNHAGTPLELVGAEGGSEDEAGGELGPGATVQRTLRHDLKEEGAHVLAVTVTYTETLHEGGQQGAGASGGRARTFRKLYQFVAQPLVAVRSKVTEMKRRERQGERRRRWIIEAQLENVGETSVALVGVSMKEQEGLKSTAAVEGGETKEATVLKPQDIEQVMFVVEEEEDGLEVEMAQGRKQLAQLHIDWRSAMGERGSLSTGWLTGRT